MGRKRAWNVKVISKMANKPEVMLTIKKENFNIQDIQSKLDIATHIAEKKNEISEKYLVGKLKGLFGRRAQDYSEWWSTKDTQP